MGAFDYAADAWGYTYGITASSARQESAPCVELFQLEASQSVATGGICAFDVCDAAALPVP